METDSFLKWMRLIPAVVALVYGFCPGSAGAAPVPTCNSFDGTGAPIYSAAIPPNATGTKSCTDFFGSGNWANSPLPAGTITGFSMVLGGSGYATPVISIADPTNPTGTCAGTAIQTAGVITGFGAPTGGCTGYSIPQVSIVDMGPGWNSGPATCGGATQPACGSGAMASAVVGGPFTGGIPKFADTLPNSVSLPTLPGGLKLANPDKNTFTGSDYYEIALVQYTQKMHSSLPLTTLRGYVQVPSGSNGCTAAQAATPSYLGPTILAQKGVPVRVKFTNCLPAGAGGNLFLPTDTTYMGAGMGPDGTNYTENRATLHLHGGATPWISDGTPHQWTVPVGETATLKTGASTEYVPDMYFNNGTVIPQCSTTVTTNCSGGTAAQLPAGASNNPGQGSMTFYWTNQQGGRLMFYHDHAYGLTRLNVYAGEAAGYLLYDPAEEAVLATATAPGSITAGDLGHLIPLVIQDKTFVPSSAQLSAQDPTWANNFGATPLSPALVGNGDLWFPHVYMTNQNPADPGLANAFGRWDYGPWFFPPQTTLTAANPNTAVTVACTSAAFPGQILQPTTACPTCGCPITPNPSGTPEGFMDTPVVNGVAYPVLHVAPAAYRFKILAAGNDRSWNLSWFKADPTQNNTEVAMVQSAPPPANGPGLPLCTAINPVAVPQLGLGLVTALLDAFGNPMNGTGLPANCWPNYGPLKGIPAPQTMWAADGRAGGTPNPTTAGPPWIQIGSEGGLLPAPVVIPATPINFEQNTRSITIGSVAMHGLWLGPAERADVIVDFSQFPGQTLILYNDAATPAPAFDSRLDYFTGDGDQTSIGGAPNTPPGYGPNTRTIMQVVVDATAPNTVPFSLSALKTAFASTATTTGVFAETQPTIIVPEAAYNSAYNNTFPNTYMGISANNLSFTPIASALPLYFDQGVPSCTVGPCNPYLDQKAIQELFTLDYGRMNATLGHENPLTTFQNQTTVPLGYVDWPTELIQAGQTQLWKITHNGVDTHFIHFHLFNVQVINRVGWDGSLRQPDPNELGWKDTVRMNPLEDILVALQPMTPTFPFPLPDSIRSMDVTKPNSVADADISGLDPTTGNATITNVNNPINLGWEYVWHCHILGHEENDMMRPIMFQVAPPAPINPAAYYNPWGGATAQTLTWTDNSASESSFTLDRDTSTLFPAPTVITVTGANSTGFNTKAYSQTVAYQDMPSAVGAVYRVRADDNFLPANPNPAMFQATSLSSSWVVFPAAVPATTTTVITAASPAIYGSALATVTVTSPAGIVTGASVTLTGAGTPITQNLVNGSTTFNLNGLAVGSYTLTATYNPVANAVGSSATATLVVTPAALTITARNASKTYGTALTFAGTEFTATGLVNGNTVTSATLASTGAPATATVVAPGPTYPILISAAVGTGLTNYTISYVNGSLTVTPAALRITANNASKIYGQAVTFAGTEFITTGLVNLNTVTSVTLTSAGTAATAAAGSYSIVPSAAVGTGLANYTITYVNGTLTVNRAQLAISANNASKIYGQVLTLPGTAFTAGGLLNTDTVTSVTLTSAGTAATAAAGSYSIVPSAAVGTGLANYTITYVNGTLTVSKATTTTTITSNTPNPSVVGQAVAFGFRVAPQFTGTPAGTVTVTAATGQACTGTLNASGVGSCSITFTTAGTRSVIATYGGNGNFLASPASASVTESVGDFTIGVTPASQTVRNTRVGTATYTVTLAPVNGITGNVALTCSGYTPGTCSVSPATRTLPGGPLTATATVTLRNGNPGRGTFNLTFTGNFGGGLLTHTAPATLTVTN